MRHSLKLLRCFSTLAEDVVSMDVITEDSDAHPVFDEMPPPTTQIAPTSHYTPASLTNRTRQGVEKVLILLHSLRIDSTQACSTFWEPKWNPLHSLLYFLGKSRTCIRTTSLWN